MLHIASPIPAAEPKNPDDLIIPARDGALRALKAARDAGIKRVVMTSSTAAICYGDARGNDKIFTEADWSNTDSADSYAYIKSKTIAERAARDFIAREGGALEFATINPSAVLGPVLGSDFSTSLEVVKKLLGGELPGLPRLGFPLVDVRDLADLHIRALTAPNMHGERFLGSGEFLWMTRYRRNPEIPAGRAGEKGADARAARFPAESGGAVRPDGEDGHPRTRPPPPVRRRPRQGGARLADPRRG